MNIVFILLVIIAAIIAWAVLSITFPVVGEILYKICLYIKKKMNITDDSEESGKEETKNEE